MGIKYTGVDHAYHVPVMVTGLEKFLKFIAGLMIMEKMEGILFHRRSRLERMNQNIRRTNAVKAYDAEHISGESGIRYLTTVNDTVAASAKGGTALKQKFRDYYQLIKFTLSFTVVFSSCDLLPAGTRDIIRLAISSFTFCSRNADHRISKCHQPGSGERHGCDDEANLQQARSGREDEC